MKIRDYYYFSDFTLSNYKKILALAKSQNYNFQNFINFSNKQNEIIWRHDVEFSTKIALEMAKIEVELGIEANYFVNIHSEFYSVFEEETFLVFLLIQECIS